MGDLLGGDLIMGYSQNPLLFNVWLAGKSVLGVQAYYGFGADLDAGLKLYHSFNPELAGSVSLIVPQLVVRFGRLLVESTCGLENSRDVSHYFISGKYIVSTGDRYSGISLRYEYFAQVFREMHLLALAYSLHFSSNR
jgi:hypothetical protein